MPITCDCGKVHEAVPQTEFDKRVKTLTDQRSTFKAQLEEAQSAFDPAEISALKADREALQGLRAENSARDALEGAGFASNIKARRVASTLYEIATEGTDAAKRPSFADWLRDEKGAGAEPTLAAFKAAALTPGKPAPGKPAPGQERKGGLPNPNAGARKDGDGTMTPEQLLQLLNQLPVGERAAKIRELGFSIPVAGQPAPVKTVEQEPAPVN